MMVERRDRILVKKELGEQPLRRLKNKRWENVRLVFRQ
jgi:hypothetical protein